VNGNLQTESLDFVPYYAKKELIHKASFSAYN